MKGNSAVTVSYAVTFFSCTVAVEPIDASIDDEITTGDTVGLAFETPCGHASIDDETTKEAVVCN